MNIFRVGVILLVSMPSHSIGQNKTQALTDLKSLLYSEKEWVKVHVAEFLIWEKQYVDKVREAFLKEEKQFGHVPKYRIGIWRVLAQAASDHKDYQYWVNKIIAAYGDENGEDRLHAIETLAKLQVPMVREMDGSLDGSMRLYSLWNYAIGTEERLEQVKKILVANLTSDKLSELEMQVTSYIFRYLGPLSDEQFGEIYAWMRVKNLSTSLHANLLAALWISFPTNGDRAVLHTRKKELFALRSQREALNHIMMALALRGDSLDREMARDLYETLRDTNQFNYNSDLHATAAYMRLKVEGVK